MKKDSALNWGQYAGMPLSALPASYLLRVIRFERAESPLAILFRKLLKAKSHASKDMGTGEEIPVPLPVTVRKRRHCLRTDKQGFKSEKSARKRIRQIRAEPGANHYKIPQHAYKCEFCDWWHLTSRG